MTVTDDLLANNAQYVETFEGPLPLPPAKHLAVVACMDARLDVYSILGLEPGESHVIRNAGGVVTDDEIRSLAISQRLLGTEEIILIHHTDCGMLTFTDDEFKKSIQDETGIKPEWAAESFPDLDEDVRQSINRIKASPFIPKTDSVRGFVFDVATGKLNEVDLTSRTRPPGPRASEQRAHDPQRTERRARSVSSSEQISCRVRTAWSTSFSGGGSPASCGGGELGVHGVQVVAQRGPGHRLPAVVARAARGSATTSSGSPSRSPTSKCARATSIGSRSSRAAVSTMPRIMYAGGHTATRTARSSGTPLLDQRVAALLEGEQLGADHQRGQLGHHLLDDDLEGVDDRLGVLGDAAAVQQPARGTLDQGAALQPHVGLHLGVELVVEGGDLRAAGCRRRRSRGPRSWPWSSSAVVALVSPASRWK